ncbi:Crp/Fnr family transcriptional regulator [Anthocerotibacter panamensis]|uniref:Crp/Fnr family transcriptional regulator n=1 Tax=Anthocerotibacter panamensis TaxID=2857077 RepID=UPI001C402DAC|nr:Crp/Fnr family transcriptional regulator [Anthocerotibacter panamensis]
MNSPFLNLLPPEVRQCLTVRKLDAHQTLFQQGQKAEAFYLLESGRLRLVGFVAQQMIDYFFVKSGEIFAEPALFLDSYPCTAIADESCKLVAIPREIFLEAMAQHPELSHALMKQIVLRFCKAKTLLELRSVRPVRERILHYLRLNTQSDKQTVVLDHALKDVASELGLAPEVLSRTLTQLEIEGILRRNKRTIWLSEQWLALRTVDKKVV